MKLILCPLSWLYSFVVRLRNLLFDKKILKSHKKNIKVISVGNITLGGSGKTPYILKLINLLQAHYKISVVYRGYKKTGKEKCIKVDLTTKPASYYGDESSLVSFLYPNIPVYVGAKRTQVVDTILEKEDVNLILLDDAFQHRSIYRDIDWLILDASDKEKDYKLLPLGKLREPMGSIQRSHIVSLHKMNFNKEIDWLRPYLTGKYLIESEVEGDCIQNLEDWLNKSNHSTAICTLSRVNLVSGIAKPWQLLETLRALNPNIELNVKNFKDHHLFSENDFQDIDGPILVTEKDAIKIKDLNINKKQFFVIKSKILWNKEDNEILRKISDLLS